MSELYAIPINGTKPKQILTTPAEDIISNKKGTVLFYHDKRDMKILGENTMYLLLHVIFGWLICKAKTH